MSIPSENINEFESFPTALRRLVEDELKAGNEVIKFGHGFPAAPLAQPIVEDLFGWMVKRISPLASNEKFQVRFLVELEPRSNKCKEAIYYAKRY